MGANLALTSGSYVKVTGWQASSNNFNRNIDATSRDITITSATEGIYLVTFSPKVSQVSSGFRAGVYINGQVVLQGRTFTPNQVAGNQESLALSLAMTLKANDVVTFEVQADNANQILLQGSTRSLLQIDVASSDLTEGMSAVKTVSSSYSTTTPTTISGWDTSSTGTFLAKNVSITPAGTLAVLRAGVFKVGAQIIISNPSNRVR